MRVFSERGLSFDFDGLNIGLDSSPRNADLVFLSHAHIDHLVRSTKRPVLTSDLTSDLASHRLGVDYEVISGLPGLELVDSGHVLGGKSLFAKGEDETLFYTGDFCTHPRFFLEGLKPRKCDTLIVEATYGVPQYDFPKPGEVLKQARDVIEDDLANGYNVVLWGYAFGKAQLLTKLVEGFGKLFAHHKVRGVNEVCRSHGFDLPVTKELDKRVSNFVYITPSRSELFKFPKARVYSFSGWGFNGVSDCFPLSDHASFTDLLRFVKACNPKKVLTHHGFGEEFASLLRVEGFDATAL